MTIASAVRSMGVKWAVVVVVAAALAAVPGAAPAAVPPLEQLLEEAAQGHPAVLLAKAKADQAQAELAVAQLEAAKQIIAQYGEYEAADKAVNSAQLQIDFDSKALKRMEDLNRATPVASQAEMDGLLLAVAKDRDMLLKLLAARDQAALGLERLDRSMRDHAGGAAAKGQSMTSTVDLAAAYTNDANVRKVLAALNLPLDSNVVKTKTTMGEDIKYLEEVSGLSITMGRPLSLNGGNDDSTQKCPLPLRGKTVGAALQAIQDQQPFVNVNCIFVIREYGLMLVGVDEAESQGYVPAIAAWKWNYNQLPAAAQSVKPDAAPAKPPAPAAATPTAVWTSTAPAPAKETPAKPVTPAAAPAPDRAR